MPVEFHIACDGPYHYGDPPKVDLELAPVGRSLPISISLPDGWFIVVTNREELPAYDGKFVQISAINDGKQFYCSARCASNALTDISIKLRAEEEEREKAKEIEQEEAQRAEEEELERQREDAASGSRGNESSDPLPTTGE